MTAITAKIARTPPAPTPTPTPIFTLLSCEVLAAAAAEADAAAAPDDEVMMAAGEDGGESGGDVTVTVSLEGAAVVGLEGGGKMSKSMLTTSPRSGCCTQAAFNASASDIDKFS